MKTNAVLQPQWSTIMPIPAEARVAPSVTEQAGEACSGTRNMRGDRSTACRPISMTGP